MVLRCEMIRNPGTAEIRPFALFIAPDLVKVCMYVSGVIDIIAVCIPPSFPFAHTVTDIQVGFELSAAVIDVSTHVIAVAVVGPGLYAAKISGFTIPFQDDIDDPGCTFRIIPGRRIRDQFHPFDAFRRQLFQHLGTVICRQAGGFAVYPDGYTGISA